MPPSPSSSLRLIGDTVIYHNPAKWIWSSPALPYHNLWIALEGTGTMENAGEKWMVRPGTAALLPPGLPVQAGSDGPGNVKNIGLHFALAKADTLHFSVIASRPVELRCLVLMQELAEHLEHLAAEKAPLEHQTSVAQLMLRVFEREARAPLEDPLDRLIRAQASDIRATLARNRSVEELARAVGLSTPQYNRRFRRLFRTTPNAYMVARRMDIARHLLRESLLPIDEIARTLGYSDTAFFSRQFKEKTGTTPRAHRTSPKN